MGYSSSLAGIGRSCSGYSMTWIQGIVCTVLLFITTKVGDSPNFSNISQQSQFSTSLGIFLKFLALIGLSYVSGIVLYATYTSF